MLPHKHPCGCQTSCNSSLDEAIPFPASVSCDTPWLTVQVAVTSSQQAANQVQTLQNDVAASEQRVADTKQTLDNTQVGLFSSR